MLPVRRSAIAASFLVFLMSCGVGDQECPSDWLANDLSDACPYGPPGGPQKKKQVRECPLVTFDTSNCSAITFEGDVFPILTGTSGNCTASGCHGTSTDAQKAKGLQFSPTITAQAFYDRLTMYTNPQGDAFWGPMDDHAWALCNFLALPGGGSPMPKPGGIIYPTDQATITKWINCGMNPPGTNVGGAGGGSTSSTM
jgi:hypothetical protein